MIEFNQEKNFFHIKNRHVSYILSIFNNVLTHTYFGERLLGYSGTFVYPGNTRGSFSPNFPNDETNTHSLAAILQEYPGVNQGDYRNPAYQISYSDGSTNSNFFFKKWEKVESTVGNPNYPMCRNKEGMVETLIITLEDSYSNVIMKLYYTIFEDSPFIVRKVEIINIGDEEIKLKQLASMSLDFPDSNRELIHLPGTWGDERKIVRESISQGIKRLESRRGTSSHNQNPFFAIVDPQTTEENGEVYGFSLIYSGNHEMIIQQDSYEQLRIQMGINHETFEWYLEPNESLMTPESIMGYSSEGLSNYSQNLHEFIHKYVIQSNFKNKERPVLINNWEATYMDFTEEQIISLMEEGAKLGIELFVLDDGWFGKRNSDKSSLGDWFVNKEKLPNGLEYLAQKASEVGIKFGLWFEPEMVSPDSELYRKHPEWIIHNIKKGISPARSQYILDLGREDVQDYLFTNLSNLLSSVEISYIKWDMNRNFSETYSNELTAKNQLEASHRYVLGLYKLLHRLTKEFPNVLFESCSGGGGRFDLGMLYYMPQIWTSDNTDPIDRLKIQYGTSLAYPISSMGAHVSASPNHQTGRVSSIKTRGHVAMSGVLGYELNLLELNKFERKEIKEQIAYYKKHRRLIQYGDFYRIKSPFDGNEVSWMFVSKDKTEAIVFYCKINSFASPSLKILKLVGLDETKTYQFEDGRELLGSELMNVGFYELTKEHQKPYGDFETKMFYLKSNDQ